MSNTIGRSSKTLSGDARSKLEDTVARFEAACNRGDRPSIDDYLPLSDCDRQTVLVELVQADVEYRLKAEEAVRVETYLERYPELARDRAVAIDLIAIEYELRRRQNPRIMPDEYLQRFPQYRDDLAPRLAAPAAETQPRKRFPIRLNCPHCKNPIEIVDEGGDDVLCPSCGSTFRIDSERTYTWAPEKLPQLGKFELLEVLGHGAFGTVYRARDTDLDRIVAVKVPRSGRFATRDDEDRFVREARAAASLRHPGIVPVYEVGRSDTFPYIVAEYIAGITLADALTGQEFGFRDSAEIIAQVADTLDDAHQNGVVHRDIKPSNILLETEQAEGHSTVRRSGPSHGSQGASGSARSAPDIRSPSQISRSRYSPSRFRPRLMDFGLARRDEGEITMTMEGQILGTPSYMSPEQAKGEAHRVDGRSDVYSLGVILYRMLVGELPFRGNSRMLLHQVLHDEPRAPRKLNDRIPRDLETITLKCLAKEPARRFQTAADLASDLRRWLDGEPIQARPVSSIERLWRWCKRNPNVAILSGGITTLLVVIAAVSTYAAITIKRQRDETREARDKALTAAEMLTTVGEDLTDVPLVQETRRDLLQKALNFYENLVANPGDPVIRQRKGLLYHRLGDVYEALHQHLSGEEASEAEKAYQDAISMFEALANEFPNEPDHRHYLARSLDYFGELLRKNTERLHEAERSYQRALELQTKLVKEFPDTLRYQQELARTENNYGLLLSAVDKPEDADQNFRQAISHLNSLIEESSRRDDAPNAVYQYELARTYINVGLNDQRQPHDKDPPYRKAIALLTDLLMPPNKPKPMYRHALAAVYLNLGNLLADDSEQLEPAEDACSQSIKLWADLVAEFPIAPLYRSELGNTYNSRGHVRWKLNRGEKAKEDWLQARDILEKLVSEFPSVPEYQSRLGMAIASPALQLLSDGQRGRARDVLQEAVEHQKRAVGSNRQSREYRLRLAFHYGDLAVAVLALDDPDQAMEFVRKAIANGYPVKLLKEEPGLKHLHDREDFQRLLFDKSQ